MSELTPQTCSMCQAKGVFWDKSSPVICSECIYGVHDALKAQLADVERELTIAARHAVIQADEIAKLTAQHEEQEEELTELEGCREQSIIRGNRVIELERRLADVERERELLRRDVQMFEDGWKAAAQREHERSDELARYMMALNAATQREGALRRQLDVAMKVVVNRAYTLTPAQIALLTPDPGRDDGPHPLDGFTPNLQR